MTEKVNTYRGPSLIAHYILPSRHPLFSALTYHCYILFLRSEQPGSRDNAMSIGTVLAIVSLVVMVLVPVLGLLFKLVVVPRSK
jgi:hypothetical protein